ncbi:MAG: alpha/beta hydrolase [Candidatus Sumerlaeota bacterium]|nr:alpha/beta hydrolase [Candidatus Sumerlaeota bacterium]
MAIPLAWKAGPRRRLWGPLAFASVLVFALASAVFSAQPTSEPASAPAKAAGKRSPSSRPSAGAGREKLTSSGAVDYVYKKVGDMELRLYVFSPADRKSGERRPAVLFFHGGAFISGDPSSYIDQCKHFSARGMVAITAAYRLKGQQNANVLDSCMDGKSAIRWVRAHAEELGVDPDRLAVGGGSAGGFIAVFAAFIEKHDDPDDDLKISCVPNALVLFNPGVEVTEEKARQKGGEEGVALVKEISPLDHVGKDAPPAIIFHGTADTTVPFETVLRFQKKMQETGNRCEIVPYEGRKHSFFNKEPDKSDTIQKSDAFLVGLGYLAKQE